jgi:malto-oligosyltrehalose trehalohydrolase
MELAYGDFHPDYYPISPYASAIRQRRQRRSVTTDSDNLGPSRLGADGWGMTEDDIDSLAGGHNAAGAQVLASGGVRFRLWAPACSQVRVALYDTGASAVSRLVDMRSAAGGWHELTDGAARAGWRYHFVLPDGQRVPDPASRFQPGDVHGPSEVVDPHGYRWNDAGWRGLPWHRAVIYELHVGAFTPEGTFTAVIGHLGHLVDLGVTALQIMPVADFPGRYNWGYDGALLYAPDATYGRPEDLKSLVDAAHAHGLMVLLDVVYNHFGPEGNYLSLYAPAFFSTRRTPWGAGNSYDGPDSPEVREFVIQNAIYWLTEYHIDGLRIDAAHAIVDESEKHLLDELADRVQAACPRAHLILENQNNEARRLMRDAQGKPRQFTAQWNDDLHHVLHVAVTGEAAGYYADYLGDAHKLSRAIAEGFCFQGEIMPYRGRPRGQPSATLPPIAFIAFIQNHDRIGNRAMGDRLSHCAAPAALRAIAAVYLLLPQVPMIFMGEEWAAAQPFPFFCDFAGELADAVRAGRRKEFAAFPGFESEASRSRIPDPQAQQTFESAKLVWEDLTDSEHANWLQFYQQLLCVRHTAIIPLLPLIAGSSSSAVTSPAGVVQVQWRVPEHGVLRLAANLTDQPVTAPPMQDAECLWQEGASGPAELSAWFVRWSFHHDPMLGLPVG